MPIFSVLIAALLSTAVPSPADTPSQAGSPGGVRGAVEALLGTRDGAVAPERWRKLGPAALPLLEEIALDREGLSTRRGRAVEGLVALRSPHAPALLLRLAQTEDEPFLVRVSAMRGAARILSSARVLAVCRPALEKASDVRLRAAAAEVLSHHRPLCAAVRAQAKREAGEALVTFEPALRRCEAK